MWRGCEVSKKFCTGVVLAALFVTGCASTEEESANQSTSAVERLLDPAETLPPADEETTTPAGPSEPIVEGDGDPEGPPMALADFEKRWTALLRRAVHPKSGAVNYGWLAARPAELRALVVAAAVEREVDDPKQRLALAINSYNLWVVVGVLNGKPKSTVRELEGFFDKDERALAGEAMTLDALRDRVIRAAGDPRVHATLCNGAIGSAPLRTEAYTAKRLDDQLTAASIRFVNDRARNGVVGGTLMLCPVFKWFAPDFEGDPFNGVAGFIRLYAEPESPLDFATRAQEKPAIEYLEFNWALNRGR